MQIKCEERYREALNHAVKTDDKTLQVCLDRLKCLEACMNGEAYLMRDRSILSLYFEIRNTAGKCVMNGDIVYHGDPDESHSATFDPTKGWQIHT